MTTTEFDTYKVLHPNYCALGCEEAASVIVNKARKSQSFGVTALAVHGLVESLTEPTLAEKINRIDMIVPDGQPVVWALNSLYKLGIAFKLPGPTLTLEVLKQADKYKLKVFLFGSTADTLSKFKQHIEITYPGLTVCGVHEDRFRDATEQEDEEDIKINAAMMAVGAAFDYHAGKLARAPLWMQKFGLEWFYRLLQEPGRLWKRYLVTNSIFIYRFAKQKLLGT